jgi:hypothetical protein
MPRLDLELVAALPKDGRNFAQSGAQYPATNLPYASVYPGKQDASGSTFTPHLVVRKVVARRAGSARESLQPICLDGE